MNTCTIVVKNRVTSSSRKFRRISLSVNGTNTGELNLLQDSVLLPPGKHRIEVITSSGDVASNPLELVISSGERVIVEICDTRLHQLSLRLLGNSDKKRNWRFLLNQTARVAVAFVILGYGPISSFRYILVPGYNYVVSKTGASRASKVFWADILTHNRLTPKAQSLLSSALEEHGEVQWPQIATKVSSIVGTNHRLIWRESTSEEDGQMKYATVVLKLTGDNESMHLVSFLTSAANNSDWRIAGFDLVYGKVRKQSFSEHLLDHPRSSGRFRVEQKIYE